jgi:hypothetical protein
MNSLSIQDQATEFLLYTAPNGQVKVEVWLHDETLWLTQKRMAELFGVGVPAISKHLENVYESGEVKARSNNFHFGNSSARRKRDDNRNPPYILGFSKTAKQSATQ